MKKILIYRKKIFGMKCIKIKEYENYRKYYFFKLFLFKKKKSYKEKTQESIIRLSEQVRWQNKQITHLNIEKKPRFQATYALSIYDLHKKTFGEYKNMHQGKDIVLLASGPTLKDYRPIKDVITIGVNRTFLYDKAKLDYLFIQDYLATEDYIDMPENYNNTHTKRFYGILQPELKDGWVIPESISIKHNANRYYTHSMWDAKYGKPPLDFAYDIVTEALYCYGSVVFPAMQFALYTNPKRIYLVGCDCESTGHFVDLPNNNNIIQTFNIILQGWEKMKKFASAYYPDTEIISINPVGLKGLFKDVYTAEVEL